MVGGDVWSKDGVPLIEAKWRRSEGMILFRRLPVEGHEADIAEGISGLRLGAMLAHYILVNFDELDEAVRAFLARDPPPGMNEEVEVPVTDYARNVRTTIRLVVRAMSEKP